MNALYMILAGNDWGNRWNYFTQQSNEAQGVLTSSDKVLSVTTMLTHPDHILSAAVRISQNGQLYDGSNIHMIVKNDELSYDL